MGGPGHPVQNLPLDLFDLLHSVLRDLWVALRDFCRAYIQLLWVLCSLVVVTCVYAVVIPCMAVLYGLGIVARIIKYAPHIFAGLCVLGAIRIIYDCGWAFLGLARAWVNYWVCQFVNPAHVHLCLDDYYQHISPQL